MGCEFDPENHIYTLDGVVIPSVTQIINSILPPFNVDQWYLDRGSAVHACAAMIAQGIEFEYDERIKGQVQAIIKFFKEIRPEVLEVEQLLYNETYRFAGTLDLYAKILNNYVIVDYKGSCDLERGSLQLGGYAAMLGPKHTKGIIVEINENGKYKMSDSIRLKPYTNKFLALRTVYGIREQMGYNKKDVEEDKYDEAESDCCNARRDIDTGLCYKCHEPCEPKRL